MTLYRRTIVKPLNERLGAVRLTELTAADVHTALVSLAAQSSTRTVLLVLRWMITMCGGGGDRAAGGA